MSGNYSIKFQPVGSAAINEQFGIRICQPRMVSGSGADEVEFDYSAYFGGRRFGFGFVGSYRESLDRKSAAILIRLNTVSVLDDILEFKAEIGCSAGDFEFFSSFSMGLLQVWGSGYGVSRTTQYLVVSNRSVLASRFAEFPAIPEGNDDDEVVIAELRVVPEMGGSL